MPAFNRLNSERAPRAGAPARLGDEDGLTLIEVVVTALMVGLISLSLVGLDAAGRAAADQSRRAQAFQVAQADQERIKGLSADQIATLNQTRTVTLDGVAFTVTSTGQFISESAGSASCSSTAAAADLGKVISTVDWTGNQRADIVIQSVVTPRAGGSLLAQTVNQNNAALPGVRVNVAGADQSTDAVRRFGITDSLGCTIFGTLLVGDYTVSPVLAGYVDFDGDSTPTATVTTTAGNTTTQKFTMGQAGAISANFSSTIGSTTYTGQRSPALTWRNTSMATDGVLAPASPAASITTTQTLFPFNTTTPSGPYTVWAGKCTVQPTPVAVSVIPGATVNLTGATAVKMPAMVVGVTHNSVAVKPAHIELTDSCGNNWQPSIRSEATMPSPTGWIGSGTTPMPGQPYGTYSICADYKFQSGSSSSSANFKKVTMTNRPNTSFTAANSTTVAIVTGSTVGFC